MKRYFLTLWVCLAVAGLAAAEEMHFVTILAEPSGSFQRVAVQDVLEINELVIGAAEGSGRAVLRATNVALEVATVGQAGTLDLQQLAPNTNTVTLNVTPNASVDVDATKLILNVSPIEVESAEFDTMQLVNNSDGSLISTYQGSDGAGGTPTYLSFQCLYQTNDEQGKAPYVLTSGATNCVASNSSSCEGVWKRAEVSFQCEEGSTTPKAILTSNLLPSSCKTFTPTLSMTSPNLTPSMTSPVEGEPCDSCSDLGCYLTGSDGCAEFRCDLVLPGQDTICTRNVLVCVGS